MRTHFRTLLSSTLLAILLLISAAPAFALPAVQIRFDVIYYPPEPMLLVL